MDFNRIVETYSDMLLRISLHYTKNLSEAEDIVQAAYLKLLEKQVSFESCEHEKAWLIRVCINLCKDHLKSAWNQRVDPIQDGALQDEDTYAFDDDKYPLLEYVRSLPSNQKIAIFLFYYEDYPVSKISEIMGAKQSTVLSWLKRGREKLKQLIKEEF